MKNVLNQAKNVLRSIFPQDKKELFLLLGLIVIYFSYSLIIGLKVPDIIKGPPYLYVDAFFSFDNKVIYNEGIQNIEGHSLLLLFTYPIIIIGNLCNYIIGPITGKILFISLVCNYMIASSVLFVYRYLNKIIKLKGYILYLITFTFAFFSTNMILAFTIESFTFTAFFLCFTVYFYSSKIASNEHVPLASSIFLAITLGGITTTNIAKGIIPIFFTNERKKTIFKRVFVIAVIFLLILLVIEYMYGIIDKMSTRYDTFVQIGDMEIYKNYIDMLWGAPMLLSGVYAKNHPAPTPPSIVLDYYNNIWPYFIIGIIGLFTLVSIVLGFKNKLIQLLILLFSVDIFIHVFLQYGIADPFIYGSHWVYLVPIFLGWLYIKLPDKLLKPYTFTLTCVFLIIVSNNFVRLYEFINLAIELY